jgi:hypothetical protein
MLKAQKGGRSVVNRKTFRQNIENDMKSNMNLPQLREYLDEPNIFVSGKTLKMI